MEEANESKSVNHDCCEWNKSQYSHGSEICEGGKMLRCDNGEWQDIGEECQKIITSTYLNKSKTAVYEKKLNAENDNSEPNFCISLQPYMGDINQIYLVNGCDQCKVVNIHWYEGRKDAWANEKVYGQKIRLIKKPLANGRIVSEKKC